MMNLDNIFINNKNFPQPNIDILCWVLEKPYKYGHFIISIKCCFHQHKIRFFEFQVLA